ncbi:MAG: hypothetical protein IPL23_16775 [Saprospiraceae bacterium]|nr:hypothetical protein [Saprospiraceae bacterium]
MKNIITSLLLLGYSSYAHSQLIESLDLRSAVLFTKIEGNFTKKYATQNDAKYECYEFNSSHLALAYIPIQKEIDCGYFEINEQIFYTENKLACDLDYGSFSVYKLNLNSDEFILLNSIANVSGTASRRVFNNLFLLNSNGIKYFPLTSIYGSERNFGDFNSDGKLDYLETSYNQFDPIYKTVFTSLDNYEFKKDQNKYIIFEKILLCNKISTKIMEKKWW